jgi:hypothetical protein
MNKSPKNIGEISEAQVIARLLLAGEVVLQPFGDNQRYDLVLDRDGVFLRVQVKTGRLRNGAVRFATASSGSQTGHDKRVSYRGSADLFAVYCPETGKVYVMPVDECGEAQRNLPLAENRFRPGIRLAASYEYPGSAAQ